jgi:HlyD family secretion protein
MTLQAAERRWASFNLREDRLGNLRLGAPVALLPADGGAPIEARIDKIRAARRIRHLARRARSRRLDLNTFLIRSDPPGAAPGLQPGMTVWLRR